MSRYDVLLNDPKKQAPPKEQQSSSAPLPQTNRPVAVPTLRSNEEQTSNPTKREFMRRSFEWYADQLRALKRLSLEEQLEGKEGNMSQMVRDALDDYLKKRAAEK